MQKYRLRRDIKGRAVARVGRGVDSAEAVRACLLANWLGMERRGYPSDVNDDEWAFAAPYLTLFCVEANK
jgi:hypothetical protein